MSRQINLYNASLRRQRELLTANAVALMAGVALLVIVALGAFSRHQAAALEAELQSLDTEAKRQQGQLVQLGAMAGVPQPAELQVLRSQLAAHRDVLGALSVYASGSQNEFSDLLGGLARQSMSGLWLTGFAVGQGGLDMEIRGRMSSPSLLPGYIRRLNAEKRFQGRQFSALNVGQGSAAPAGSESGKAEVAKFVEFSLLGAKVREPAASGGVEVR